VCAGELGLPGCPVGRPSGKPSAGKLALGDFGGPLLPERAPEVRERKAAITQPPDDTRPLTLALGWLAGWLARRAARKAP